jgi:hypothetical protein
MAGATLQGRRVRGDQLDLREPGDYQLLLDRLWCLLPSGEHARIDERWGIEEHDDGTISIVAAPGQSSYSIQTPKWHGFLERGVWREV